MIALVSQNAGIVFSVCGNRLLYCFHCPRALFHPATNPPELFLIQLPGWQCHVPGCHQRKLFGIPVITMQRHDLGNRQISVTNDKLLAGAHTMEERAKLIL